MNQRNYKKCHIVTMTGPTYLNISTSKYTGAIFTKILEPLLCFKSKNYSQLPRLFTPQPFMAVRVLFSSWTGGRAGGWAAAAATLSRPDLCHQKLEEVQTWHTCSYHDLVVQRHGQTWVQPLTLTL